MINNQDHRNHDDEIDLRMLFSNMRRKWHYFLISFLFFGTCALLYIHFSLPVYEASSSILVKDGNNSSKEIEDILSGDLYGNTKNIATEIGIIRSRSVLEETIRELNLETSLYSKNGLFDFPLYKTSPFNVKLIRISDGIYDEEFNVTLIDSMRYQIELKADNLFLDDYNFEGTFMFGEEIKTPYFTINVARNNHVIFDSKEKEYFFIINSMNNLITDYTENMKVEPLNKDATIIQITIQDNIIDRAIDFLNTLVKVYIKRDVQDKSAIAALTLKFVDEQLDEIRKSLNTSEVELQKFKEQRGTVDLSEESRAYLERVTVVDEKRIKAEIDLRSLDYLYEYVTGSKDVGTMSPTTIGNPDPILVGLITRLKELQSKRKSLEYGSSSRSPAIKVIDEQIEQTKQDLIENINSIRNLTKSNLEGLNKQLNSYENSIRKIPNIERELLAIQRNFTVNQNIFLYLLQKKAETGIAKATAVSDNKILDDASFNEIPVIPDKKAVIIVMLIIALLLPAILILLLGFLKNTINSKEDVEKLTNIPIIGVVGHISSGERLVVTTKPKSSIAEAFRSIRANLMFFGLADKHKIILITSSVSGEGKSFSTLNLAAVLTLQHYKVIIVGMDLRKPQMIEDLGVQNTDGVSTFLIGKTSYENLIQKTKITGLDVITSGPIPPNPAELLAKKETILLLETLRSSYDYIIIDTPPVGIVSDAMMLMNYADINLFILRENYSRKEYIRTINTYYSQEKARNLCILLNDSGTDKRYGYGYYEN